jgi:hypothetical protein
MAVVPFERASRGRATILIIDSSEPSARVHAAVCHLAGYDVVVLPPSELKSRLPPRCQPALVLVGVAHAASPRPAVRGLAPGTPAVLISGSRGDATRAAELRYDAVITRPVRPSHLRDTIRQVLADASERRFRKSAPAHTVRDPEPIEEMGLDQYAELRAASQRLREQSRELREYARQLRRRACRRPELSPRPDPLRQSRRGGVSNPSST